MKGVFLFIFYQFVISIINSFILRKPKSYKLEKLPKVSVLIPARNEEKKIERCVKSLLNQEYPYFEVIVLNDNSSDRTLEILKTIREEKLLVIDGAGEPPSEWTGKNWACFKLSQKASGDLIIFTDADTYYEKNAISSVIQDFENSGLDFASGIPREEVFTFGEKITVPFINFSIFSIFPIFLAYVTKFLYFFMFANGQFIIFRKASYEKIKGHEAVKSEIVEDIELSKLAKKHGLRTAIFNLSDIVSCRMYTNFKDAFFGLSKSYFPLFQMRLLPSIFIWIWVLVLTFAPFYVLIFYRLPQMKIFAGFSVVETLFIWSITTVKFKLPFEIPLYYPLTSLINSIIGFSSIILGLMGKSSWKGRVIKTKDIRLI